MGALEALLYAVLKIDILGPDGRCEIHYNFHMIRSKPELEVEGIEVPTYAQHHHILESVYRTQVSELRNDTYIRQLEHPISPECQLHNPLCA